MTAPSHSGRALRWRRPLLCLLFALLLASFVALPARASSTGSGDDHDHDHEHSTSTGPADDHHDHDHDHEVGSSTGAEGDHHDHDHDHSTSTAAAGGHDDHDHDHDHDHEGPAGDDHDHDHDHDDHAEESSPLVGSFERRPNGTVQAGAPFTQADCSGAVDPSAPAAFFALPSTLFNISHDHANESYALLPAHPSCAEVDAHAWTEIAGRTLVRQCGALWISVGVVDAAPASHGAPATEAGLVVVVRDGVSGGFCATHLSKLLSAGHDDHDDHGAATAASTSASWRTWVYSMIGVMISCLVSLIGIVVLMCHRRRVQSFLPELLALSSGTFIGSVIFSLLPETAMEVGMTVDVTAVILGGILFGMLSETAIHGGAHFLIDRRRRRKCPAVASRADADADSGVVTVQMVRTSSDESAMMTTKAATAGEPAAEECGNCDPTASPPSDADANKPVVAVQQGEACSEQSHVGHHHAHEAVAPAAVSVADCANVTCATVRVHIDSPAACDDDVDTIAADSPQAAAPTCTTQKVVASPESSPESSHTHTEHAHAHNHDVDSKHAHKKKAAFHAHQHGKEDEDDGGAHGHSHGGHSHGGDDDSSLLLSDPKHAAMINCLADAIHNFIDGALIGATFLVNPSAGWTTTVAITLHELPQELSDFALLLHAGLSTAQAAAVNFLVSLSAVVGAIVAIAVGEHFSVEVLNVLPFAVGLFLYLSLAVLVPIMMRAKGERVWRVWLAFAVGIGLMAVLLALPWGHEHGDGEAAGAHAGHGH